MSYLPELLRGEQVVAGCDLSTPVRTRLTVTPLRVLLTTPRELLAQSSYGEVEHALSERLRRVHRFRMWTAEAPVQLQSKDDAVHDLAAYINAQVAAWNAERGIRLRIAGLSLTDDTIICGDTVHPVRGARAEVLTGAALATRAASEPSGFGQLLRRRLDERKAFLVVTGPDLEQVVEIHPDRVPTAETFAAAVTAFAGEPAPMGPDLPGQIAALVALRDRGDLSEEEFSAAKARLLG